MNSRVEHYQVRRRLRYESSLSSNSSQSTFPRFYFDRLTDAEGGNGRKNFEVGGRWSDRWSDRSVVLIQSFIHSSFVRDLRSGRSVDAVSHTDN